MRHIYFLLLPLASAIETVTIKSSIGDTHACVTKCLYYPGVYTDMGSAMQCDRPYDNACYCATATASASAAVNFLSSCASRYCAAGDMARDLQSMQGVYAGYCAAAGFDQPIVNEWLTTTQDSPKETGSGPKVSTRMTVVTQTASPGGEGGATSTTGDNLSIVDITSTVVVDANGNVVSDGESGSSGLSVGGIVGISVGAAVLLGAFIFWFIMRRRRNSNVNAHLLGGAIYPPQQQYQQQQQYNQYHQHVSQYPPVPPFTSPPVRKPLAITTTPAGTNTASINTLGANDVSAPLPPVPVSPISPSTTPPPTYSAEISSEVEPTLLPNTVPFPERVAQPPVQVPGMHEVGGVSSNGSLISANGRGVEIPADQLRGVEMPTNGPSAEMPTNTPRSELGTPPHRPTEMATSHLQRPTEMATVGHEPATHFEMSGAPTTATIHEMAVEGHEPATHFEMNAGDVPRRAELGGSQ